MPLSYDFDMVPLVPRETQAKFAKTFDRLGLMEQISAPRAQFRDASAIAALRGASPEIQRCFLESGFGLDTYDSGAGPGAYYDDDGPSRASVMERLLNQIEVLPENLNWNGFDIAEFAEAAVNAAPVAAGVPPSAPQAAPVRPVSLSTSEPVAPAQTDASAASLDDFFSAKPSGAETRSEEPARGPDMDAFFSDTSGSAAKGPAREMTPEDIRMTIDTTSEPVRAGFSPVKMGLMVVALFVAVIFFAGGDVGEQLVDAATGGALSEVGN